MNRREKTDPTLPSEYSPNHKQVEEQIHLKRLQKKGILTVGFKAEQGTKMLNQHGNPIFNKKCIQLTGQAIGLLVDRFLQSRSMQLHVAQSRQ